MKIDQGVFQDTMSLTQSHTIQDSRNSIQEQNPEPNSEVKAKTSSSSKRQRHFKEIGSGNCGVIYDMLNASRVIKKQTTNYVLNDTRTHNLWQESKMHRKVFRALTRANVSDMSVPILDGYLGLNTEPKAYVAWWRENGHRFPDRPRKLSPVMQTERITPLPLEIRNQVLDQFCNPMVKQMARTSVRSKHCLMAPLLGSRRGSNDEGDHMRAYEDVRDLRNFDLHVDQMETLHMDILKYCRTYAQALALMHYSANIDANGVKFRLGSRPQRTDQNTSDASRQASQSSNKPKSSNTQLAHLWLFNFDKCNRLQSGPELMDQMVQGFISNPKPYWPRPRHDDQGTNPADKCYWRYFSREYIKFARQFTRTVFPRKFIRAIERHYAHEDVGPVVEAPSDKTKEDVTEHRSKNVVRKGDLLGDLHPTRYTPQMRDIQTPQLEYSVRLQLLRRGIDLDTTC